MRVTVQNTVDVSADIEPAQINAYLLLRGWVQERRDAVFSQWARRINARAEWYVDVPLGTWMSDWSREAARTVACIADHEDRQPGDVLLDIAKEPV